MTSDTKEPSQIDGNGVHLPQDVKSDLRRELMRFVKAVVLVLGAVLLCRTFLFESWPVQGPSMLPTLSENDRVLVYKLPVFLAKLPLLGHIQPVQTGDLVVFQMTDPEKQRLIKRVIAAGPARAGGGVVRADAVDARGVGVLFDRGAVYVANRLLEEPYLTPAERRSADYDEKILASGQYYVLGDHRSVSKDSRLLGPIHSEQIVGKAVLRIWPLRKFGWL